jgi:cell division septal protein FtsQ
VAEPRDRSVIPQNEERSIHSSPPDDPQLDLPFTQERRPPVLRKARPVEASVGDAEIDPPFLRPRERTRVQRARRGPMGRAPIVLHVGAIVVVATVALWQGYSRVMASERLKVTKVDVRGGHFLSEGEVRELLGPAVGENILAINIESLKQRLRSSPWVGDAHVERSLPDTLRIEIEERRPVALAEIDRLYLMDGEGSLIEMYGPRTAGFDLPIVRGLAGLGPEERGERARRVALLLADVGDLGSEMSEVRALAGGDLEAVLRGGEVVRFGGPPYRNKFMTFLGLRASLRERCKDAEFFDLRFRGRISVQERGRVEAPVAATP